MHTTTDRVARWRSTVVLGAATLGLLGVVAGAFGAHALRGVVVGRDLEIWQTAARYQQIHAVLLVVVGLCTVSPSRALKASAVLLVVGMLVFSGTLYTIVLGGPRILGAVTPLGGLCLMGGWGALGVHALQLRGTSD